MNGRLIFEIFMMWVLNTIISMCVHFFIPNYYIAEIIASVVISFIFAVLEQWVDRAHFYRYPRFWYTFFIMGIVFVLFDVLFFII